MNIVKKNIQNLHLIMDILPNISVGNVRNHNKKNILFIIINQRERVEFIDLINNINGLEGTKNKKIGNYF